MTKYTSLKFLIKPLIVLAAVAVLLGVAWAFFSCRGCGDRPRSPTPEGIPEGWHGGATQKTPIIGYNEASEKTAGFKAGTKVVVVRPPKGRLAEVAILPNGEIVAPPGTEIEIYEKRPPIVNLEFRPFLGAGATVKPAGGISPAGVFGVDVVRVWRLHTGPAACVDSEAVAGVWTASISCWRNVDACAGGGYGTAGPVGFAGVSIGIQ
jgi:hypothetical protein